MVGALRADDGQVTKSRARRCSRISYVLGYNAAGVGVGVFTLATAAVALRTRVLLPRWLALLMIAALLVPLGRLADAFGRRRVLIWGPALFESP